MANPRRLLEGLLDRLAGHVAITKDSHALTFGCHRPSYPSRELGEPKGRPFTGRTAARRRAPAYVGDRCYGPLVRVYQVPITDIFRGDPGIFHSRSNPEALRGGSLLWRGKDVAETVAVLDVARAIQIRLDLAAQAVNGLPHQLDFALVAGAPHPLQKILGTNRRQRS